MYLDSNWFFPYSCVRPEISVVLPSIVFSLCSKELTLRKVSSRRIATCVHYINVQWFYPPKYVSVTFQQCNLWHVRSEVPMNILIVLILRFNWSINNCGDQLKTFGNPTWLQKWEPSLSSSLTSPSCLDADTPAPNLRALMSVPNAWWTILVCVAVAANEDRIIGGNECHEDRHPSLVLIYDSMGPYCSGTLINENWVITAAHCYKRQERGKGQGRPI